MKKRNEIEEKYKWDLSSYFSSLEEFEKSYNYVAENYKKLENYRDNLNNKKDILECLKMQSELSSILSKLYVYASLIVKEDSSNSQNKNRLTKLETLGLKISESTSYIEVELAKNSDEFLTSLAQDKHFCNYDLFLQDLVKNKKYLLSEKEEKLLAQCSDFASQFSDIFDMFDSSDVKFEDILDKNGKAHKLNNSNYGIFAQSTDRILRKNAYKSMNSAYKKINKTLWANYIGNVKSDCFYAKIRGHKSALAASMFSEDVDENIYKMLCHSVEENLDVYYRYFDVKRKILGVDNLAIYDMNAPLFTNNKSYTFEDSFSLIKDALKPLGQDYIDILCLAKEQRWIDIYPNENKDTGAFSWGAYAANPVVMLNHENTLSCAFTIAHEMGHALHTYYSNKNQVFEKAGYEIFVAEVASTTNEMLLAFYMLKNAKTDDEKKFFVDHICKMFVSTVHRQTMFARFEEYVHSAYENDDDTTFDTLNEYFYDLNKKYFGKQVELVEETKYLWSRIPHFYTSFYVYKYATGLISAFYIASAIFECNEEVLKGYREFLTLGSTKDPVSLLKVAKVDLAKKETFDKVFKKLEEYISILEK